MPKFCRWITKNYVSKNHSSQKCYYNKDLLGTENYTVKYSYFYWEFYVISNEGLDCFLSSCLKSEIFLLSSQSKLIVFDNLKFLKNIYFTLERTCNIKKSIKLNFIVF